MTPTRNRAKWSLAALPIAILVMLAALPQQGHQLAVVDSDQIVPQMPGYGEADSIFQSETAAWRAELQPMQAALDSAVRAFDQQSLTLSESARNEKMDELQQMSVQVQRRSDELSQRAQARFRELMAPLQDRARTVIDGLRAERNIAMVFEITSPGIVSVDPAIDLTPIVISRLRGEP
jgi:Skp family chaperone for outer membrane proteins